MTRIGTKLAWLFAVLSLTASAQTPDTIFVNGKIVTVDARSSVQQALAVHAGRITALGRNADIRNLAGPATRVVDLGGRTVIPGLIDSHLHAIRAALTFTHRGELDRRALAAARPLARITRRGEGAAAGRVADRRRRLERAAVRREAPSDAGGASRPRRPTIPSTCSSATAGS